jgi:hypothetical protein
MKLLSPLGEICYNFASIKLEERKQQGAKNKE